MAQSFQVDVLYDNIGKVTAVVAAAAAAAVAKSAHDIEAQAKSRAPVRTGFLKNSIHAEQEGPHAWRVDVQAEYGAYVEFGTVRMSARPYFIPAVEQVRPSFQSAMAAIIPR